MPTEAATAVEPAPPPAYGAWLKHWPLLAGLAVLSISTIATLGRQVWSREDGAHGPIILATGGWLLWRQADSLVSNRRPASIWLIAPALIFALCLFVFGRVFGFISVETAGVYLTAVTMLYSVFGLTSLLKNWFPIAYLAFLIPPPGWVLDKLTAPLKQFVSFVSTEAMSLVGVPIAREGVTIHVAQYQLLVEDACSGMNSLVGLIAISLFYIYLLRGASLRYAGVLTLFVIPIAILGNIGRIIVLILLTYFFGDEVAQGFAHQAAGIFLFAVDLLLVFLVDSLLIRILPKAWRPAT